ncbi:MAG TPA: phosphoribosylformylglycinamidine cyclo-ligase [Gammaproteobacteria bacterium]|nr:phosphoribosylformylglycinamidine cyclo-ligase [Gammaproteobacteria bacterium]
MVPNNQESNTKSPSAVPLSYRNAGVDIDAGNALVGAIKSITKRTSRPEVLTELGGFGALCELPRNYQEPVLVAATDGVGTKLMLAQQLAKHDTIGIDLVAMCVNDLIVCGAEPLFFLDYYATGGLDISVAKQVVTGIGTGCELAGCALIGGETAEMPGMYKPKDYDLAGFAVGVVEKAGIIDQSSIQEGDVLIGIDSSGPHSNGYSLIRKVISRSGANLAKVFESSTLGEVLLAPTKIYVKQVAELKRIVEVSALAHITGGGILENLPRVLPQSLAARVDVDAWSRPAIFKWLQDSGNIEEREMMRTFNCGIGMIAAVRSAEVQIALDSLNKDSQCAQVIGEVVSRSAGSEALRLG